MKNNFLIIAMLLLGFSFNSCDDNLEILPEDSIAVELGFDNEVDFQNAVRGIYSGFRRDGYFGAGSGVATVAFIGDVISDNVIINASGRRSRETYYDWRYDEDDSSENMWLSAYKVIQRSNLILENIANIDGNPIQANIQGEALAARGIAHFDLAKFYSSSPAQAGGEELGIPYVKSTDSALLPTRNTLSDTYDQIIDDLTTAQNLLNADNGIGRINSNVVSAMLSRIYLFMGDNGSVITSANAVTGMEVSRANFSNVWKDEVETGVIWKIKVVEVDDVSIGVSWFQESPDGEIRSEYNVDLGLYNLYADNDIRKEAYFETSEFSGSIYNHIVKYRGRLVGNANEVDAKVIRYAEVLLNKAEAQAATGDDGGALVSLDALRSNRYDNFASGNESGQSLKDAIQLERRLELAFEGHRFFDLKRQGLSINRSTSGDKADGTGEAPEFPTLEAGDHRFNMAIGEGEIDANPNIQQTAGY